ncbi:hypothetical protein CISG_03925 [Coccidioides immitis RMSCC 3703]|uniref:Uncharacterized protein n=1 Tax=Coccidioides immitis RMSCC 3703 TaxID=454286 RepID=A0A0J8TJP0_COCIT|nr:hypothetical protein CISG_03925 [Coccidioides immitis RMSCC 3703]
MKGLIFFYSEFSLIYLRPPPLLCAGGSYLQHYWHISGSVILKHSSDHHKDNIYCYFSPISHPRKQLTRSTRKSHIPYLKEYSSISTTPKPILPLQDMERNPISLAIRGVQALFGIIVLGLTAYMLPKGPWSLQLPALCGLWTAFIVFLHAGFLGTHPVPDPRIPFADNWR